MRSRRRYGSITRLLLGLALTTAAATGVHAQGYVQTNLISNLSTLGAAHIDPDLRNPWGIAFFPGQSPFWVNNNGAGTSALYFASGAPFPLQPVAILTA